MSLIRRVLNWLVGFRPTYRFRRKTAPARLLELRSACFTLLDDVPTAAGKGLQARVETAAGANEFWHMRPRLFDAVSEVHGEGVAAQRLRPLDTLLQVHHDRRSQFANASAAPAGTDLGRRRASDAARLRNSR